MKINKDSWHYRFTTWGGDTPETNLCPYVQKLILKALLLGTAGVVIALAGGSMLALPWTYSNEAPTALMLIGITCWAVSAFLGVCALAMWAGEKQEERNQGKPAKPPGLLTSYIKAKHDKICPMLEFKD